MSEELDDLLDECGPFELFEFPNTLLKLSLITALSEKTSITDIQ